uniref:BH3-interacting domain death agonist n=1 Tax=Acanthochromis polyacanthus TaxID=80966 RepID=A0A3Q1FBA7_9TELE
MENLNVQNASLVILAFLKADCWDSDYRRELISLGSHLNLTKDINSNGPWIESSEDEGLECDGHLQSNIRDSLQDLEPLVELQWPRDHVEAAAVRRIAEDLREVAAQLEHHIVARAIRNLSSNIQASHSEQWKLHLAREVERVMRQGVGLEHLPQERVAVALTLTLVKGVCVSAPRLLRGLFNAALQYLR